MATARLSGSIMLCVLAALVVGWSAAGQSKRPGSPIITPSGGAYGLNAQIRVSIRSEPGSIIVYTLDGENPDYNHGTRTEANTVFFYLPAGDVTVKAVAIKPGLPKSIIRRADFVRRG